MRQSWDLLAVAGLLIATNLHLLGVGPEASAYAFGANTWPWLALLTHSFVHVSWYHLLLDAGAFFTLYPLCGDSPLRRLPILAACAAGALAGAMLNPSLAASGFCGLSGIDHGLMAFTALRLLGERGQRTIGAAVLAVVSLKVFAELGTGGVILASLHIGDVGQPNVWSHAGGVLAAILAARDAWIPVRARVADAVS
jgi:membrane associated rhomboid family serine protease